MKRTALKRKHWRRALGTAEQRLRFKHAVLEADGGCVMDWRPASVTDPLRGHFCSGPLQAAHVIRKHTLRKRGFGAEVVYSVDAAMTLCEAHHQLHDSYALRVPDSRIPERCQEFVKRIEAGTVPE